MYTFQGKPRTSFVNLMNVLQSASGEAGPNQRIGGNSADESAYVPTNDPLPLNVTYRITDTDFNAYLMTVPLFNGSITPGLNFFSPDNTSLAVAHVNALATIVPWKMIDGLEIGNECDLFAHNGIRGPNFTMSDYLSQFDVYQRDVATKAQAPYPKIQGATFCCHNSHFDAGVPAYAQQYASTGVLSSFSYHHYPLNVCNGNKVQLWELMTDDASTHAAIQLAPMIKSVTSQRIPFFIGEGNSVACGGAYGISDTMAAALWAVDTLFNVAAVGVTRWNFHGCFAGAYTAIGYNNTSADIPDVRPLFYGMWVFTEATAHHAVIYNTTTVSSTNSYIKSHSTLDQFGTWRVVVVHKDYNATQDAQITVQLPAGVKLTQAASLATLKTSSGEITSRYGLSFQGQTFDGSQDGKPVGPPAPTSVPASTDGASYTFTMSPTSIAVLTLPQA
jgi:hypothetical protein